MLKKKARAAAGGRGGVSEEKKSGDVARQMWGEGLSGERAV